MLIPVVYPDGRHDLIKPDLLDRLLSESAVTRFRRADGWVEVSNGEPRRGRRVYAFPERRAAYRKDNLLQ